MRFIKYSIGDHQRLGLLWPDQKHVIDLSELKCSFTSLESFLYSDITMKELEKKIEFLFNIPLNRGFRILPPLEKPGKIIGVAYNYKQYFLERNLPLPLEPTFFGKIPSTIIGQGDPIVAHRYAKKLDWSTALAVIIGEEASRVKRWHAMEYVFGYTIAQDITARDWLTDRNGGQYLIGKSMDTFCPLGPMVVHKNAIKDVNNLNILTHVNGVCKQRSNTSQMIFKIEDLIFRISQFITLMPGDVILTGTPRGEGVYRNPPEFLKPGDIVESTISQIGTLRNEVVDPPPLPEFKSCKKHPVEDIFPGLPV